jgi:hypothetical protein
VRETKALILPEYVNFGHFPGLDAKLEQNNFTVLIWLNTFHCISNCGSSEQHSERTVKHYDLEHSKELLSTHLGTKEGNWL